MTGRASYGIALCLLLLAALLRIHDLANLPLGFTEDEIINIRLVDNVRQGDIYVFYPGEDGGREGIYHVLVAFATSFVGEGTIGFRILSVWLGMLSIALIYSLGRHLFNPIVAVVAMGLVTVNMSSILLSRVVSSDATVLFLVSANLLALARSLPVYRRARVVTSNVLSFAALGALLGISIYLHPSSLYIVLGTLLYIGQLLYMRSAMFRQAGSYTGFAILLMLILSMPYLISSINLPHFSGLQRALAEYDSNIVESALAGLQGIARAGDIDPRHNLPGRPLVDVFCALFMAAGLIICAQRRHRPRFMLMLLLFIAALPAALVVENSPDFFRMSVIMPFLAIFTGFGVYSLLRLPLFRDLVFRRLAIVAVLALLALNALWTWQDLFADWRHHEEVMPLVNGDLGQIAHYLDGVGNAMPSVFCNPAWHLKQPEPALNNTDKTLLMMNRRDYIYHEADCRHSLLLSNGGERQLIVFFDEQAREEAHPYFQEWLAHGKALTRRLPRKAIIELETRQLLAERAGVLTTTAPLSYAPEVAEPMPLAPPIRFGDNLTFLGYEPNVPRVFEPSQAVEVITYWRAEGALPPDLTLFTHILSDPITNFSNSDVIYVNPELLRGRDVFIQVTAVPIPELARPGTYFVSIGAYRQNTLDQPRLTVLRDDLPLGDRLFLYEIELLPPAAAGSGG